MDEERQFVSSWELGHVFLDMVTKAFSRYHGDGVMAAALIGVWEQ